MYAYAPEHLDWLKIKEVIEISFQKLMKHFLFFTHLIVRKGSLEQMH